MSKSNGAAKPADSGRDIAAEMEALAAKMDRLQRELAGEPDPEEKARKERERLEARQRECDRREAELSERAAELCRTVLQPKHRAIVNRMAAALRELEAAIVAEEELHQELAPFGYARPGSFHMLPYIGFPNVGRLSDPNSSASRWFEYVRGRGYAVDEPAQLEPQTSGALVEASPDPAPEPEAEKPVRRGLTAFRHRREAEQQASERS